MPCGKITDDMNIKEVIEKHPEVVPVFQKYYDSIALGKESVGLVYQSHHHETNFSDVFREFGFGNIAKIRIWWSVVA